jgi:putative aldouronate transport system substrate-binding protein
MKSKILKMITLVLAVGMTFSSLTGCSKKTVQQEVPVKTATDPYDKLPKEISVSAFDRGEVPAEEGNYENNRWTKYINEKSGIKVNWVPVPRTQAQQKLNTLIASGQAPDLIWEFDRAYIGQLVDQGIAQPIDQYIEKYSTSYKKYIAQHPELKPFVTFNGKTYAATNARGIDSIANHGMWIRQDWLDKLGLKTPTTTDELLAVAKAFKEKDPDGNGKDDTYGFALHLNWPGVVGAFFMASPGLQYVENGKAIADGRTLDRFQDVLDFKKKMFDGGLVDKEFITDTNYTRQKQLWVTGKAGIYLSNWKSAEFSDLKKNVPTAKPMPLESVSSKYGKNGLWQEPPAHRYVVFNKDIKNPKAAVEFLDWMIDKGWFTMMFGEEGVHHKMVNGVPQTISTEKNNKELKYAQDYPVLNQWNVKPEFFKVMDAQDPISQEFAELKGQALALTMKNKFRRDLPVAPSYPEASQIAAEFRPLADEIEIKVMTGGSKYAPDWGIKQIQSEWNRLGGEKVNKILDEWYQKNK